jgi:hypothetical protein
MRGFLTVSLVGVGLYSLYCLVMMALNHRKGSGIPLVSLLLPNHLTDVGLRYYNRYLVCILLAAILATLWFIFVQPI